MPPETRDESEPDPVSAYDCIAASYPEIAALRQKYLEGVDNIIVQQIIGRGMDREGSKFLDVGAGTGERAARIAGRARLHPLVLLEPSSGMRGRMRSGPEIWPIRMEQLHSEEGLFANRQFDVITCLWNVIGHVKGAESRARVLGELAKLLATDGLLFLDVNHRYNIPSYGVLQTAGRFLRDQLWPTEHNGDVSVEWIYGPSSQSCKTYGHVFTGREMKQLFRSAGLLIEKRMVVSYEDGRTCRFAIQGNLLYCLRRKNRTSDSDSAAQTSSTSASVI